MQQTHDFDVIIIGAGITGLSLALALSQADFRVALIEAKAAAKPFAETSDYGLRVSALTRASERLLTKLGAWSAIRHMRYTPYYHMRVWDQFSQGEVNFSANMVNQPNLGYIVENDVILTALAEQCQRQSNIQLYYSTQIASVNLSPSPILTLVDGQLLSGECVVGADGARSWLRDQVGLSVRQHAYQQSAIVATIQTQRPHEFTARQIFLEHGPLAFLPFADEHHCSIVWSQSSTQAQTLLDLSPPAFNRALTKAFQETLGECSVVGSRAAFPLRRSHANHYIKAGCALIGDAAHSIHPLAGQGLNLGLLDVACLAEVLQYAKQRQRPLASEATLKRYQRQRRWHNGAVMRLMECFHYGFGQHTGPVNKIREQGMLLVDRCGWLKQSVLKSALGLSGPLPEMVRFC